MGLFSKTPEQLYEKAAALMRNRSTLAKGWEMMVKAAEKGDRLAQCTLGSKYYGGYADLNIKQDRKKALEWYRKSAEQLFPYAMSMTALCYGWEEELESSPKEALAWLQLMVTKGFGDTPLDWAQIGTDENGKKIPYTAKQLRDETMETGAENMDAEELYEYGRYFDSFTGLGVYAAAPDFGGIKKNDYQAVYWYAKAAEKGNADAQNCMGIIRQLGKGGFDKDILEAARWYVAAARQGHEKALQNLSGICRNPNDFLARKIEAMDENVFHAIFQKKEEEADRLLDEIFESAKY